LSILSKANDRFDSVNRFDLRVVEEDEVIAVLTLSKASVDSVK
jgi:hypothetical protein